MKDKKTLIIVMVLTAFAKVLEWSAQYIFYQQTQGKEFMPQTLVLLSQLFNPKIMAFQIFFIMALGLIYYGFFYQLGVKKQSSYLIIPALAYFTKEVVNFIIIYDFTLNQTTLIALFIEPVVLYLLIWGLNKSWLKLR